MKIIYYHTSWACYGRNYKVADIPIDYTPNLQYAFFNVGQDGKIFSGDTWADFEQRYTNSGIQPYDSWNTTDANTFYGNFGQFKKLKDSGKQFNLGLSIGGWSWSKNFSPAVSTSLNRSNFIKSLLDIFRKFPIFNSVSIDWEYFSNDGINYGDVGNLANKDDEKNLKILLTDLRYALQSNGMSNYKIAVCCSADPDKVKFNISEMSKLVDELHIMTYDFHDGNWGETKSGHHTNPLKSSKWKFSCEESIDFYLKNGAEANKLYIGGAFYSRGFSNTTELGGSANGGSLDMSWEKGVVDYKQLPLEGSMEFNDPESKGAYSYDPFKKIINTYDNTVSLEEKCNLVRKYNIGGMIIWETSGDVRDTSSNRSLIKFLHNQVIQPKPLPPPIQPITINPQPTQPVTNPTKSSKLHVSLTLDDKFNLVSSNVSNID